LPHYATTRITILPKCAPEAGGASRLNLIQTEHLVDHRLDPVCRNSADHRLEHLRRADRNALNVARRANISPD
jgi:hypothetical protein